MAANPTVYSIRDFCAVSGIGKSFLYKLWKRGAGPSSIKLGRRRLITESPADYLRHAGESEPARHGPESCTFEIQPSALIEWQNLPPEARIVIMTVRKHGRDVPSILSVTLPRT